MSAPAERLRHGSLRNPVLTSERIRTSLRGIDSGELVYMAAERGLFNAGASVPDFSGLRIQEVEERVVAGDIEVTLTVEGLLAGDVKIISEVWNEDPFTWDECVLTVIVRRNSEHAWAAVLAGHANMRLMHVGNEDRRDATWAVRTLTYRGIRKPGLVHRVVTVNDNIVSPEGPVTISAPLEDTFSNQIATVSLNRIVVNDTYKSTALPDTARIPGPLNGTEIAARSMPAVQVVSLTGDGIRRNWPSGWRWTSMDPEELYRGAGIWIHKEVMEYAPVWTL